MTTKHSIQYGHSTIEYDLTFSPRKTLAIDVHPDLSVAVQAPEGTELADIEAKVRKRAPWILRQQRQFEVYLPKLPPRQYDSGETHRYLGRQYRLKVIANDTGVVGSENGAEQRGFLWVLLHSAVVRFSMCRRP